MKGINHGLLVDLFFTSWWIWQPFKIPTAKAKTSRAETFKVAIIYSKG